MRKYANNVQDRAGNAIAGAAVSVVTFPGAAAASLYSDNGVTPLTQPLTTDANGYFEFYVADGHYNIVVTSAGISSTFTDVLIVDDGPTGTPTLQSLNLSGASAVASPAANGQACSIKALTELTTIAAAAFTDTTIQMPAGAIVVGVATRVVTAITCTTNFTVGDSGSANRFSTAAIAKAAGSTDKGTKAGAYYNAGALSVRITPDTVPSDATGRVRVVIFYISVTPPTS